MKMFRNWERLAIGLMVLILLSFVFIPHVVGLLSGKGNHFTYITEPETNDINSYFSWIKQGELGKISLSDLYTSESSSNFSPPLFVGLGLIKYFFQLPTVVIWYLARLVADVFLLLSAVYFIKFFVSKQSTRIIAYIVVLFGSGFGLIIRSLPDYFQPEATIYQILRWPIVFSLSLGFLLWGFIFALKFLTDKSWKHGLIAGTLGLLVVLVHPYDILAFFRVILAFLLYLYLTSIIRFNLKESLKIFALLGIPLLGILYFYYLYYTQWVFLMTSHAQMTEVSALSYILGFGFVFVFAIGGVIISALKKQLNGNEIFLLLWIISSFLFMLGPPAWRIKVAMGLIIPLGIFAAIFISKTWEFIRSHRPPTLFLVLVGLLGLYFFIIITGTNVLIFSEDMQRARSMSFPYYLTDDMYKSFSWMSASLRDNSVILSAFDTGSFIPRYTGQHVFVGHWAQTINLGAKLSQVNYFYGNRYDSHLQKQFLSENGITYIYFGPEEQKIGPDFMERDGNYQILYSNSTVKIYSLK